MAEHIADSINMTATEAAEAEAREAAARADHRQDAFLTKLSDILLVFRTLDGAERRMVLALLASTMSDPDEPPVLWDGRV